MGIKRFSAELREVGVGDDTLDAISAEHLESLERLFRKAQHEQRSQLRDATEASLNHLPRLLRGQVRKLLIRS